MSSHLTISQVSDDVFVRILEYCLYVGCEHCVSVDYVDHTAPGADFAQRQSFFAMNTVLVSRRFHRVGMGVLWKYVVVRTRRHLLSLAQQARNGPVLVPGSPLGIHAARLDMRIRGEYDVDIFIQLLRHMSVLEILVLRNSLDAPTVDPPRLPPTFSDSFLYCCPRLKRLEFNSPHDLPSEYQLRDINVQVVSLL